MRSDHTRAGVVASLVVAVLGLAACTAPAADKLLGGELTIGSLDLAAAGCPAEIRIATDWFPQAEQGHLYELIGDGYAIETESEYSVRGPLMASGEYTGVHVTVISGGDATLAFLQPDAMMYSDSTILMGYVASDKAVLDAADFPTVGVFAPLEKDPAMIMWDPEALPDVESIADLGVAGIPILAVPNSSVIEYLVSENILSEEQIDYSYTGSYSGFVAGGGAVAQQGSASADPYIYENEIADWMKPVDYELTDGTGYPRYPTVVSVIPENVEKYSDCLTALVPVLQQAELDYYSDPADTNALILDAVDTFDTFWVYSPGLADYSVATQMELGIVGNGPDDTVGNVDNDRLQNLIDVVYDLYGDSQNLTPGLTARDIFTDQFIDPSLGF